MNVQVLADPAGRLLWVSPALPGAVHDIRAAREHGILDGLVSADIDCWADKGYQGAGPAVRVPYRSCWETLSEGQQAVNRPWVSESCREATDPRRRPGPWAGDGQLLDGIAQRVWVLSPAML